MVTARLSRLRFGEKRKRRRSIPNSLSPSDDREGLDLTPPPGGYELYVHRNAGAVKTKNWHGFYWARRNEEGDYEIRTVPVSSGEYSASGGVWPREGFEKHYVRAAR
jgi:hypothetical protein